MNKLFVSYDLALLSREKGFDEPCFGIYYSKDQTLSQYKGFPDSGDEDDFSFTQNSHTTDTWVSAPLSQQLINWFEIKGILISNFPYTSGNHKWQIWKIVSIGENNIKWVEHLSRIDTVEKAFEEGFKLINEQSNIV